MADRYLNYIGGTWVPAESGEFFENRNPADANDLIGLFPKSASIDVDRAVKAAEIAFDAWRLTPAPKRGEILYRLGRILEDRKEECARLMTREMGKIIKETPVYFINYLYMPWKHFFEQADRPLLKCFWKNCMIGIAECADADVPGLIPDQLFLVNQDTHQFRNSQGRVRIVELNCNFLGEQRYVGIFDLVTPYNILHRR